MFLQKSAARLSSPASVSGTFFRAISSSTPQQSPPNPSHWKFTPGAHPLDSQPDETRNPMFKKKLSLPPLSSSPSSSPSASVPPTPTAALSYLLHQPAYTPEEVASVHPTHVEPKGVRDRLALLAITVVRKTFDFATGYGRRRFTEEDWLRRIIFLETVAGVPGMVGGMHRHMKSLRTMRRDRGWVHTLLEECENERMHLLTFLKLKQPGPLFRFMVLMGQGVMFNAYFLLYWAFPRFCHRFVGYLEEEAVKTYTHLLEELDHGHLPLWKGMAAPSIARNYWRLEEGSTLRDVFLAVRADEANHRDVNHILSQISQDEANPFSPPPDEDSPKTSKA